MDTDEASSLVRPQLVVDDLARTVNSTQPPYDDDDDDDDDDDKTLPPPETPEARPARRSPKPRLAKKAAGPRRSKDMDIAFYCRKAAREKKRNGGAGDKTDKTKDEEIASLKKELARKDRELERRKDEAAMLRLKLEGIRKVVGSPLRCIYSQDKGGRSIRK